MEFFLFFSEVADPDLQHFTEKKGSIADLFLWIKRCFSEQLFYRVPSGDCFCILMEYQILFKELQRWLSLSSNKFTLAFEGTRVKFEICYKVKNKDTQFQVLG